MPPSLEAPHALLGAAQTLRELCQDRRAREVAVVRGSDARLLARIDPAAQRVYATKPLELIVDALASGAGAFTEIDRAQAQPPLPGAHVADEALERLAWLLGARLGEALGLAPWLDAHASYRLQRWPDFGEIGSDPQGATLCKTLARQGMSITALTDATQLPLRRVHGLLNSLSLCGVLESAPRPATNLARPPSGLTSSPAQPLAAAPPGVRSAGATAPQGWFARAWKHIRAGFTA